MDLAVKWAPVILSSILVVIGWIWGASHLVSRLKSNELKIEAYKKTNEKNLKILSESVAKELERLEKASDKFGEDLHRYNTNTQGVINLMKEKQIAPLEEKVRYLEKSDETFTTALEKVTASFGKFYALIHEVETQVAVMNERQSNG